MASARVQGYVLKPVGAQGPDVRVSLHHDKEVAVEGLHLADGLGPVVIQVVLLAVKLHDGHGEERSEVLLHSDRAGSGSAAAVRGRESLVEVEVHHIEAHVAGAANAQNRVGVGPVVVQEAALIVDYLVIPSMFSSNNPKVLGLVSISRRVSSITFANASSTSARESDSDCTVWNLQDA